MPNITVRLQREEMQYIEYHANDIDGPYPTHYISFGPDCEMILSNEQMQWLLMALENQWRFVDAITFNATNNDELENAE